MEGLARAAGARAGEVTAAGRAPRRSPGGGLQNLQTRPASTPSPSSFKLALLLRSAFSKSVTVALTPR
jgi:hypothetical protein